jgi:SAM-dependent methyltransferase
MPAAAPHSEIAATDAVNQRSWGSNLWAYSYRKADQLFPAEAALFASHAAELAEARLLDLGIGTGRTTGLLSARVKTYVGLDYSPAMIERARTRFPNCDLRVADARDLAAFADSSFDVVLFSFNGIDYVDHDGRLQVLRECARVLRPSGLLMFSSHNRAVPVPRAWDLANLKLSAHPVRLLRGVAGYAHGIVNAAWLKRFERATADYALRNDAANHYGLLTYYIDAASQCRQLTACGFEDVTLTALDGSPRMRESWSARQDYMLHYCARRR